MSGTLNGVELCMLHGSWVLEMVFGEALNSMQYGPCAESTNFLGDMRDCMDSVCCELQYMGYVLFFLHRHGCGHRRQCNTGYN